METPGWTGRRGLNGSPARLCPSGEWGGADRSRRPSADQAIGRPSDLAPEGTGYFGQPGGGTGDRLPFGPTASMAVTWGRYACNLAARWSFGLLAKTPAGAARPDLSRQSTKRKTCSCFLLYVWHVR